MAKKVEGRASKKTKAKKAANRIRRPDGRIARKVVKRVDGRIARKIAKKVHERVDARIAHKAKPKVGRKAKPAPKGRAAAPAKAPAAMGRGRYEVVGTTADVAIKALGRTHNDLFTNAAYGLADLMTDTRTVHGTEMREVVSTAPTEDRLLVTFLTELLVLREAEGFAISSVEARVSTPDILSPQWRLFAIVWGERYDPARHEMQHDVKAVTYHTLEVRPDMGYARVLFDI
jgi:SHS2 domain-containing protein